jgi:hypothetical protein
MFGYIPVVYQEDKRSDFSATRTLMFNTGSTEPASFHLLLCVAANDLAVKNRALDSGDVIRHHMAALSLIKGDVAFSKLNPSDGFLAAVILLAGHEV